MCTDSVLGSALEHDGFGIMREGLTDMVAEFHSLFSLLTLLSWNPLSGALPLDAGVFLVCFSRLW